MSRSKFSAIGMWRSLHGLAKSSYWKASSKPMALETRHGVGGVVAIHRRLVGKTLIGGEYARVGGVLRDKKADGAWFVDTHVIGHME